jgi:hypothetical protein
MINIINAPVDAAETISQMLVDYYIYINQTYGLDVYKTDYQIMLKHVSQRLQDPASLFKYFLVVDENGKSVGFANVLTKPIGEILVIYLIPEANNEGNAEKVLDFVIDQFKVAGTSHIIASLGDVDQKLLTGMKKYTNGVVERKYIIKL